MNRSLAALFPLLILSTSLAFAVGPTHVRATEEAMQRRLIKKVNPFVPAGAAQIHGVVALKVLVNKAGSVENIEVISGHPMLVTPAIEAVKQWKYKPLPLMEMLWKLRLRFT